jgi:hypothetical protein
MIEKLADCVNGNERLVYRGRLVHTTFLLDVGSESWLVYIHEGRVTEIRKGPFVMPRWTFALRASPEAWQSFWSPVQAAQGRRRHAHFHGQSVLFQGRPRCPEERSMTVTVEPITGRYLRLDLLGEPHRLYVEEAGQGVPLLCLHTAGSDSRQYRAVLNDPEILRDFHVIAFDLPWQILAAYGLARAARVSAHVERLRRDHHHGNRCAPP